MCDIVLLYALKKRKYYCNRINIRLVLIFDQFRPPFWGSNINTDEILYMDFYNTFKARVGLNGRSNINPTPSQKKTVSKQDVEKAIDAVDALAFLDGALDD